MGWFSSVADESQCSEKGGDDGYEAIHKGVVRRPKKSMKHSPSSD